MANIEHLDMFKAGVEIWNNWRRDNPDIEVDLSDVRFSARYHFRWEYTNELFLDTIMFDAPEWVGATGVNLSRANLRGAYLEHAYLMQADFSQANLSHTKLSGAHLAGANLSGANLRHADLSSADLSGCLLVGANLTNANLRECFLAGADLSEAQFTCTDFSYATLKETIFENSDLSQSIGLETVAHGGPSRLSRDIYIKSRGKIPDVFLWGCGLSDWEIEAVQLYNPDLGNEDVNKILYRMYDFRAGQSIQISPLFISYSHADGDFVDKIEAHLKKKGIRSWRDIHDMKAGPMEKQVDRAMRLNPTVLLILSEHSLNSDWVEHEVHAARELARELGRDVLCPIRLDDSWRDSRWEKRLMEQVLKYNLVDFSGWKDEKKFAANFDKLIDGLELFYKG